jgi:hypothetical protein
MSGYSDGYSQQLRSYLAQQSVLAHISATADCSFIIAQPSPTSDPKIRFRKRISKNRTLKVSYFKLADCYATSAVRFATFLLAGSNL